MQPKQQAAKALEAMLVKALKAVALREQDLEELRQQLRHLELPLPDARKALGLVA